MVELFEKAAEVNGQFLYFLEQVREILRNLVRVTSLWAKYEVRTYRIQNRVIPTI
jgi:hypothetical protein